MHECILSKHCGYWCSGAKAPGHQYSLCWWNIHCMGPVSFTANIFTEWNNILKIITQSFKGSYHFVSLALARDCLGPLLLTYIDRNYGMAKSLHQLFSMGCNYSSRPFLQLRFRLSSEEMALMMRFYHSWITPMTAYRIWTSHQNQVMS